MILTHSHVRFVHEPAPAERSGVASASFCQENSELLYPVRHRLPAYVRAALGQQVADLWASKWLSRATGSLARL